MQLSMDVKRRKILCKNNWSNIHNFKHRACKRSGVGGLSLQ